MDNSFISKENINNIYDNINVYFVKNHNYNLDDYDKYKKIVKKISKTIFNSIKNNNSYKNILANDFNDLVLNKSIEFLKKDLESKYTKQSVNVKSSNSNLIESVKIGEKKKNKSKKISSINPDVFNSFNDLETPNEISTNFADNLDNFNSQVKQANKKIKDNFKKIIDESKNNFDLDTKTEPLNNNKLAFEQIIEDKLDENNLTESTESVYDEYNNASVNDILSSVIFKQKDNSKSNQLESYEGESYLPNLIKPVGEEAPIQPLIYQNTGRGTERINTKIITIDSGIGINNTLDTVTNTGSSSSSFWHKFRVNLQDTISIDKLCDVYLKSVIAIGITNNINCNYLVIDIDEFNMHNYSNNVNMRNEITILNNVVSPLSTAQAQVDGTVTNSASVDIDNINNTIVVGMVVYGNGVDADVTVDDINDTATQITLSSIQTTITDNTILTFVPSYSGVLNVNYPSESNYITTINPSKLVNLNVSITNQDNQSVDNGDNNTFDIANNTNNRFIMELEIKSRSERDDLIYEKNEYSA